MDVMIDPQLIADQRKERAWSQEHLASVAGLSLRTIQRVERSGTCSLETKKALASAFGIPVAALDAKVEATTRDAGIVRGRNFGFAGVMVGLVAAYAGISYSLFHGHIGTGEAGAFYGLTAAIAGALCAMIGALSHRQRKLNEA